MSIPAELKYSKDHEWIKIDGDIASVGITEYAQGELGDVVFVEMPDVDDEFDAEESFGSIEAVKAVSDLLMPLTGTVIEINEKLEDSPDLVNSDPYGEAWMIKIKISNPDEANNLLSADEYQNHIS